MNELFKYFLTNCVSPVLLLCFLFVILCGIAATDGIPLAKGLLTFLTDLAILLIALFVQLAISMFRLVVKLFSMACSCAGSSGK